MEDLKALAIKVLERQSKVLKQSHTPETGETPLRLPESVLRSLADDQQLERLRRWTPPEGSRTM